MVLQGSVTSVCHEGNPCCFHVGTVELPSGNAEFQHDSDEFSRGAVSSAHRSANTPLLSREKPS